MNSRFGRVALLVVLLVSGAAVGFYVWTTESRLAALQARQTSLDATVIGLARSLATVDALRQARADYGLSDETLIAGLSPVIRNVAADAAALRPSGIESSAGQLEEFWTSLSALTTAEAAAGKSPREGNGLTAADRLMAALDRHVPELQQRLDSFRSAETGVYAAEAANLRMRLGAALAGVALLWLVGLVALTPRRPAPFTVDRDEDARLDRIETPVADPAPVPNTPAGPTSALPNRLAELSNDIARMTDATDLSAVLERLSTLLDARGIIIWMGAGDQLLAAAATGYDRTVLNRLPPIGRTADNATAAAWRTGEFRTVAAEASDLGAIVAPMVGSHGCIGVLSAEVRHGRENDPEVCAAAAIVASQLATVLAAWPAASPRPAHSSERVERSNDSNDSDRQAAAS